MPEMPKFEKSPPELVERFGRVLERTARPDTTRRQMFGYPAAFVNGNLATGLFADSWFVRLPAASGNAGGASETEAAVDFRPFSPMPGRPMKGYLLLPPAIVADDAALETWVGRALEHTATLPPKSK